MSVGIYRGMTEAECEWQYNLRALRPDFETTVIAPWIERSAEARRKLHGRLDVAYGPGARHRLDLFPSGSRRAPCLIYIHGGYWQSGDKSIYSFLAEPFNRAGIDCAIVGYDLCPSVTITQIAQQIRTALAWLAANGKDAGLAMHGIVMTGHSAGGHLTEMMMGTDWSAQAVPEIGDAIKAAVPISPISDLEPLVHTSINAALGLDREAAIQQSPLHSCPPRTDAPQVVVCGEKESAEFHRQADIYAEKFNTVGRSVERLTVPAVDHFDIISTLADANGGFFDRVATLALA